MITHCIKKKIHKSLTNTGCSWTTLKSSRKDVDFTGFEDCSLEAIFSTFSFGSFTRNNTAKVAMNTAIPEI